MLIAKIKPDPKPDPSRNPNPYLDYEVATAAVATAIPHLSSHFKSFRHSGFELETFTEDWIASVTLTLTLTLTLIRGLDSLRLRHLLRY